MATGCSRCGCACDHSVLLQPVQRILRPDPDPAPITFQVDMTNELVSEDGVWLIGNITTPQWQAGALQMSDADGDNVYDVTYEVSGAAFFEYRYCNGDPYPAGDIDNTVTEVGDFEAGRMWTRQSLWRVQPHPHAVRSARSTRGVLLYELLGLQWRYRGDGHWHRRAARFCGA